MDTTTPAPVIRRYPVRSSSLAEIGYDPGTLTLEVVFQAREGRPAPVWRYQPVTPATYAAILNAESIGQAFNKLVKQESTKPTATVQARRVGAPTGEGVTLSLAEMTTACANIGLDLTCGGCAAQFFTGIGASCSPGCKTVRGGTSARADRQAEAQS